MRQLVRLLFETPVLSLVDFEQRSEELVELFELVFQ